MESKFKRIGILGASGTGKTRLAQFITAEYQLQYLNSSSSKLWDRYGYKNHRDVVEDAFKNPSAWIDLQNDILELRRGMLMGNAYFVTDRTPVDQAAYFLSYFPSLNFINKAGFISRLREQIKSFDALIFIRYDNASIEDNGVRIQDPLYQLQIDYTMQMILDKDVLGIKVPILVLDKWHWLDRVEKVKAFLKP